MQGKINEVAGKAEALMTEYAKSHGSTPAPEASDQQNATVLDAVSSTDITKVIIEGYNVKSGLPAPPPQQGSRSIGVVGTRSTPDPGKVKTGNRDQGPEAKFKVCSSKFTFAAS